MVLTLEVTTFEATLAEVTLLLLVITALLDVASNKIMLCAPTISAVVLPTTIAARAANRLAGVIPVAMLISLTLSSYIYQDTTKANGLL